MNIRYFPYSRNLNSPADRRRVVPWAKVRKHSLAVNSPSRADVTICNPTSNFSQKRGEPVVFDLVDAYFVRENPAHDLARGVSKRMTGKLGGQINKFSSSIIRRIESANAVVCETIEQASLIAQWNSNVHPILDFHDEFPTIRERDIGDLVMWEGSPHTLIGLKEIDQQLCRWLSVNKCRLLIVTDLKFKKFANSYITTNVTKQVSSLRLSKEKRLEFLPWSIQNVALGLSKAKFMVLPLDTSKEFNRLKAENRLLMYLQAGVPTITSAIYSYQRIESLLNGRFVAKTQDNWMELFEVAVKEQENQMKFMERAREFLKTENSTEKKLNAWDRVFESIF